MGRPHVPIEHNLAQLPADLLERIASQLLGFELLALAHASKCTLGVLSQEHLWTAKVPKTHLTLASTSKERYARQSRSFLFPGKPKANEAGVCVRTCSYAPVGASMRDAFGSWGQPFSLETWFCIFPGDDATWTGGVLLGAQSSAASDVAALEEPSSYMLFAFVDSERNLYCSVLESSERNVPVASGLEFHRWYHLALIYSDGELAVYLNGMHAVTHSGPLHRKWRSVHSAQVGTGYVSGDPEKGSESSCSGWYGFNGVVDCFRVFRYALSDADIRYLANHEDPAAVEPVYCIKRDYRGHTRLSTLRQVYCSRPQERWCMLNPHLDDNLSDSIDRI